MNVMVGQYEYNFFESIKSTQDFAKQFILDNRNKYSHFIIHANKQNAGLGRSANRQWISNENGLTFSFSHLINAIGINTAQLTYLIAIAIRKTLLEFISDIDIFYKWPNDIIIQDRKLCGILVEIFENHLIFGIGINIKKDLEIASYVSNYIALEEVTTANIIQKSLIEKIIVNYDELYLEYERNGFVNIRLLWLEHAYQLNKKVNIHNFDNSRLSGIFRGIDDMGYLLIENNSKYKEIMDCYKLEFMN